MASVKLISEEEATGKVKDLYEEIKEKLGIDFVPNLYRAMASNPEYLEANWQGPGGHGRVQTAGQPYQRDHRGRRLGGERLPLLTGRPHLRGAEVRAGRRRDRRADGRRRSVQRLQQADGRARGRARREALVRLRRGATGVAVSDSHRHHRRSQRSRPPPEPTAPPNGRRGFGGWVTPTENRGVAGSIPALATSM
jgi:hypothetical protein